MTTQTKQAWTPGAMKAAQALSRRFHLPLTENVAEIIAQEIVEDRAADYGRGYAEGILAERKRSKAPEMAELLRELTNRRPKDTNPTNIKERAERLLADLEAK